MSTTISSGVDGVLPKDSATSIQSSAVEVLPPDFYDAFLSKIAKERKPSPIRGLFPLEKTPGVISLLAGKPNAATFPFTSLHFNTRLPSDPSKEVSLTVDSDVLSEGLQYSGTDGIAPLLSWLFDLQERQHSRKRGEGWRLSVTAGSQDAIYKAIQALVDPGDAVLVEKPVYAGVIPIFESLHCEMVEVETDGQGIDSKSLRSILENWPSSKARPRVLYTVPYGCNPTGMTATLERRLEVLELSRKYNFLILEDDPYYYLYFGDAPRIPSYFTLETQTGVAGRVLRFDSFSKILSAGIRIGFVTGPNPLLRAIDMHTSSANLQASSFAQSIVFTLLDAWGYDGFLAHTHTVSQFYRQKRDVFEAALHRQLGGLAEWDTPEAGMFFWFKLLLSDNSEEEGDSAAIIQTKAFEGGVLALPGTVFLPNGAKTAYVRASFSLLGEEEVNEALRRLREVILKERGQSA